MSDEALDNKFNFYRFLPWIALVVAIGLVLAVFLNAPPRKVAIAAGPKGGFFDTTARMLRDKLKEDGVAVDILHTDETLNIIKEVDDRKSNVDIGFIAHEVDHDKYENIQSLGSIIMDPLFIYLRPGLNITSPSQFVGLKLGVSPANSGARIVTDVILDLYGIHESNATFVPLSLMEMATAIEEGKIDVAFFLQPTNNKVVARLGEEGKVKLMSLERADAIMKKYGYLHHLTIDQGGFNLEKNLPPTDVQMVGIPVTVISKDDLHPAIVTAVALALKDAFRAPTLVTARGAFPNMDLERDLDSNADAEKIYKSGTGYVPPLYKVLNFWIAGVLDKIVLLLSFVLSVYVFFSFMGFPSLYSMWVSTTADRYVATLEHLHKKSLKEPLSERELERIRRIELHFTESNHASKKASKLISDITARHPGHKRSSAV